MLSLLLEKRLKWLFLKRLSDSFRLIFWQSANCSGSSHMLSPSVSSQMVLISVLLDTQGVLLYGPPGTGKTLLARAVAHHTDCTFIRVSGSELVQKFIGEGELLCLNTVISHFLSLFTFQKLFKSTRLYNLNSSLSLFQVPEWCVSSSSWLENTLPPSSSWMRSTPSGRLAWRAAQVVTVRCRGRCWSCSISWTASRPPRTSRYREIIPFAFDSVVKIKCYCLF